MSLALASLAHWTNGIAPTPTPTQNPAQSQILTSAQVPVPAPILAQIPAAGGTQQTDTVPTSELKSAPPTPIAKRRCNSVTIKHGNRSGTRLSKRDFRPTCFRP